MRGDMGGAAAVAASLLATAKLQLPIRLVRAFAHSIAATEQMLVANKDVHVACHLVLPLYGFHTAHAVCV